MADIESNIGNVVVGLTVVQGEVDNVLSAAIRDVALEIEKHIRDNWPIDTGESYKGWTTRVSGLDAAIENPTDYTSYVHKGLAEQLFKEGLAAAEADVEALLSDRVRALLEQNSGASGTGG